MPKLNHPFSKEILPDVQSEHSLVQHVVMSSCPATSCLGEVADPDFATTSFQVESDRSTLSLLFSSSLTINQSSFLCVFSAQNIWLFCKGMKIKRCAFFSKEPVGDDLEAGSSKGKYVGDLH